MAEFKNLGSFWKAEGKTYKLSGTIEINGQRHKCYLFTNKKKTEEKHPDYSLSVEVLETKDEKPTPTPPVATPTPISVNDVEF